MKKIRVKFSGTVANKYFLRILQRHYDVELSEQPDYLFYSVQSTDYLNYDCVKIFFTLENLTPDFNICDYAIGFDNLSFGDRYLRYPIYLISNYYYHSGDDYGNDLRRAQIKHIDVETKLAEKQNFCSFVYSNAIAAPCRKQIFEYLSNYKVVSSGGRYKNNIGRIVVNKTKFQSKHKFVIAFENTSSSGYTTEKIVHAFSANTIPVYWGNPGIENEFNKNSFINCNQYGLNAHNLKENEKALKKILLRISEIDNDDTLYLKMLAEPAFINSHYVSDKEKELEIFLCNIFDQKYEKSFRRNRYYWGARYERKQKIGLKFYLFLKKIQSIWECIKKGSGKKG